MTSVLSKAWHDVLRPLIFRPKHVQVAALCYRKTRDGKKDVLLVTSRGTKRWILPKGWPIDGLNGAETALQEAWEEAGVKAAEVSKDPVGQFEYPKELDTGGITQVETEVYLTRVDELSKTYQESGQRERKWV